MKLIFSLLLIFMAITCLNSTAQNISNVIPTDSLKTEILTILNNGKWNFWFRNKSNESAPATKSVQSKELNDNISIINNNILFQVETNLVTLDLNNAGSWISLQHDNNDLYLGYDIEISHKPFSKSYGPKKFNSESAKCKQELERVYTLLKHYQKSVRTEFYNSEIEKFKPIADHYKQQNEKPQLEEEQRKYIVQANSSNEMKDYYLAIELYEKAIKINPTSYPSAYYNLALIGAQIKNYEYSIFNMNRYLMLVPDSEDARSAQDKIYEWELLIQK